MKAFACSALLLSIIITVVAIPYAVVFGTGYYIGYKNGYIKRSAEEIELYKTNIKQADRDIEEGRREGRK